MNTGWIILIAIGLGIDAFAVAIGIGAGRAYLHPTPVFRLSTAFGLFQFAMFIIGWHAGSAVVEWIAHYDHWVAFLILALVGLKMIKEGVGKEKGTTAQDPTQGWTLLLLSLATSIDSLAVGFSLALVKFSIWRPALVIGIVCFLMTASGMAFGRALARIFGLKVEIFGGFVLILIGLKILFEHL